MNPYEQLNAYNFFSQKAFINNKIWCFSNLWNTATENFLKLVRIQYHAHCARPLCPLIEPLVFLAVIDSAHPRGWK